MNNPVWKAMDVHNSAEILVEYIGELEDVIAGAVMPSDRGECLNCGRSFLSVEGGNYCDRDCEMGWRKFVPLESRNL